jgi:hypothetical protein
MWEQLSAYEFHELYCPRKNTKSALLLVALFSLETFQGWKRLHKAPDRPDLITLASLIILTVLLAKSLVNFTCFRERLIFILILVGLVADYVFEFYPAIIGTHVLLANSIISSLWTLALLVSLTMLFQSFRSPRIQMTDRQAAIAKLSTRILLYTLAAILAILILGALMYFLPLGQLLGRPGR